MNEDALNAEWYVQIQTLLAKHNFHVIDGLPQAISEYHIPYVTWINGDIVAEAAGYPRFAHWPAGLEKLIADRAAEGHDTWVWRMRPAVRLGKTGCVHRVRFRFHTMQMTTEQAQLAAARRLVWEAEHETQPEAVPAPVPAVIPGALREQMARALGNAKFDRSTPQPGFTREPWLTEAMPQLLREVDAMLGVLAVVDHKLLDFARAGLPLESGSAARFWITAINAIKQGAA